MSLIEDYWKKFNESNKDLDLYSHSPCLEEFYSKYNKLSKKKYYEYILESNLDVTKFICIKKKV